MVKKLHPKKIRRAGVQAAKDAKRKVIILDLRIKGLSIPQIAAHEFVRANKGTVRRLLAEAMRECVAPKVEELKGMELERLDVMLSAHMFKATKGDIPATYAALGILDRRYKILGLEAPKTLRTQQLDKDGQGTDPTPAFGVLNLTIEQAKP